MFVKSRSNKPGIINLSNYKYVDTRDGVDLNGNELYTITFHCEKSPEHWKYNDRLERDMEYSKIYDAI